MTRPIILLLSLSAVLSSFPGCSDKATYVRGDKGSSGQISFNPLTGAFNVSITGPFEVCRIPTDYKGEAVCVPNEQPNTETP